jgi:hypothetical protein
MILAVPYFGANPRFEKLLAHWWERYLSSGTSLPAIVVTDQVTHIPHGYPVLRVDMLHVNRVIRGTSGLGHTFDYKGALVVAASRYLGGDVLFLDIDAFVTRDPAPLLAKLAPQAVALQTDSWARPGIVLRWHEYIECPMQNAGVIFIGREVDRHELGETYARLFRTLQDDHREEPWLEQFTWSAVWHHFGRHVLPVRLNWAHTLPGDRTEVAIFHAHGDEKWRITGL